MRRVTYHLAEEQVRRLRELAARTGLSVAELIRRAVDLMLGEPDKDQRRKP